VKKVLLTAFGLTTIIVSVLFTSFVFSQKIVQGTIVISALAIGSFKWLFAGLLLFFVVIGLLSQKK